MRQVGRKDKPLSWAVYHLDPDEVNTRAESLCAYAGAAPVLNRADPCDFTLTGEAIVTKVLTAEK